MHSFLRISPESHFPIQNLPYGIFSTRIDSVPRPGVAIGDFVLDLKVVACANLFSSRALTDCFAHPTLNAFMALGKPFWLEARSLIQKVLSSDEPTLRDNPDLCVRALIPAADVIMHVPAHIGDYTDFFCSKEHATNCGLMFRSAQTALNENWLHLPVGYHGRASSIVISGTDVRRPWGQVKPPGAASPQFAPSSVLDYELEVACFIGGPSNSMGEPIPIDRAHDHIFGFVLMNDWSARDIQKWEYVPLGPFNSKNWATTISPWIVTPEALEPFACQAPTQDPLPLQYLTATAECCPTNYDISLEATLRPVEGTESTVLTKSNLKSLYWTIPQMIAHHTANGCPFKPGDMIATGTVSVDGPGGQGCMLELSWNGTRSIPLQGGGERKFLLDGDEVVLTGYCQGDGYLVGFGECRGKVVPALNSSPSCC